VTGYLAAATRGFDAAYPKLAVAKLLSDSAVALYPKTLSLCIPEMTASDSPFAQLAPSAWFRDGADVGDVLKVARVNDPTDLTIRSPLLVEQGKADTTVIPTLTDEMVQALRGRGTKVSYKTYKNVGHADIVSNHAADDATAWIATRFK